jgi:hypothetical protein
VLPWGWTKMEDYSEAYVGREFRVVYVVQPDTKEVKKVQGFLGQKYSTPPYGYLWVPQLGYTMPTYDTVEEAVAVARSQAREEIFKLQLAILELQRIAYS